MTDEAPLRLEELRRALTLLLDAAERQYGPAIELNADYYWTIGPWDAFRFDAGDAPAPTLGQLSDDVASMRAMLEAAEDRPVVVWHDLTHVVGVLNRLAALDLPGSGGGGAGGRSGVTPG